MNTVNRMMLGMILVVSFASPALAGDTLDAVKKNGVLVVGVRNMMPPFGFVDQKTKTYNGEAEKIFNEWFGPASSYPLQQRIKITATK